jgi:hypothetical protein
VTSNIETRVKKALEPILTSTLDKVYKENRFANKCDPLVWTKLLLNWLKTSFPHGTDLSTDVVYSKNTTIIDTATNVDTGTVFGVMFI